jgi:hypothetical protein
VATASADGTARLWNALSGQPIGEIMRHGPPHPRVPSQKSLPALTAAAAFSADGVWRGDTVNTNHALHAIRGERILQSIFPSSAGCRSA